MSPQPAPLPTRPLITPAPGSHLESLLEQYEAAKTAENEAKERTKALNDGIKAESVTLAMMEHGLEQPPRAVQIAGSSTRPGYTVSWKPDTWIPVEPLRTEHPEIFAQYGKAGGHWETRKSTS